MNCRLCLNIASESMQLFEGIGLSLKAASVIAKYFWFEPKNDDPISTVVCVECWTRVNDFNEFYCTVEKAHRLLTERFSVKEEYHLQEQLEQEADEFLAEAVGNRISDSSSSEASFSNEKFLNDVAEPAFSNDSVAVFEPEPEERRQTRSSASAKNKMEQAANKSSSPENPNARVKRRGRPRKGSQKPEESQKNKRYADYKKSMLEIDMKIAQHMRLSCDICHEGQETFLLLCKHMLQVHKRKGYATCCNKKFYKRSFLTDHIDRHIDPDKFKCDLCGKTFADKQCLRNHELLKHQPDEEKTFKCEHCPKRYTKQYLLDQHRIIHQERTLPCEICDRRFPNISLLSTHIKIVHGNYGTMCDICAQVIRGRAAFKRHQLEHAGVTEPKVQCDICGSWHKNKYSLKKHIRRHNGSSEECTCNICGKVSPNRSAMLSHQRYVHLADRKFECSVCSKAFKKAITLKEHMTMHTGEVLYKCPHCPKTFNSNANKHSHRKKCHPKEFEEARKARTENRMVNSDGSATANRATVTDPEPDQISNLVDSQIITITTDEGGGDTTTHNILVTTDEHIPEELKGEGIVFTLS
ncbi:transcription factor grauzone [Scaptodrosophila lebanonensis]|uniref:Transcription factor grauzone n=1 Tax=Drosophila lebanonensis TaxID=7225 RepID=A0A6J2TFK9_DROLE|nr:transcription factor grauzone [Scaptodrosophila lebanonensis]